MVDKRTVYAGLIDIVGTILMVGFIFISPTVGLLIQLACYFIVYRYFKDKFWKAFAFSVAVIVILFFVGMLSFTYMISNIHLS
jgi:hypothetical protein